MNGEFWGLSMTYWIILAGALVTYATRFGGHLVLSRFHTIPPRVNAALNAVPAAVITTLVAPAAVSNGLAEGITILIVLLVGLRFPLMIIFGIGWAAIIALRAAGL